MPDGDGQSTQPNTTGQVADGQPAINAAPATNWKASLPEDLRKEKSLEAIQDVSSLAKSYVDAEKIVGGSIRIPKEGADQKEWDAFYSKLGRPESPEKYEVKRPMLKDGVSWDEGMEKGFLAQGHKLGLTKAQAQGVMEFYSEYLNQKSQTTKEGYQKVVDDFKKEWGANYERNLAYAEGALRKFGDPELSDFLTNSGLNHHPGIVKMLMKIGESIQEDDIVKEGLVGTTGAEEARAKIAAINADTKHPYWNEGPGHKEAVAEMQRLFQIAYPK